MFHLSKDSLAIYGNNSMTFSIVSGYRGGCENKTNSPQFSILVIFVVCST